MRAILFDLSGVLIDPFDSWLIIFNETLEKFGKRKLSKGEYMKYLGIGERTTLRKLGFPDDVLDDAFNDLKERHESHIEEIKIFPETRKILRSLSKKFKLGLVTNNSTEYVKKTLEYFDLEKYFDVIVTLDGDHSYPPDAISYLLEAFLHLEADFLNASRFPVRDRRAMSFKHKFGNLVLSLAMSLVWFRWVRDSQSGMWVLRRSILEEMDLVSDGMAFSEEIKIEALRNPRVHFAEISIQYSSRLGEVKLNPWRDGFHNLFFLIGKRFSRRSKRGII